MLPKDKIGSGMGIFGTVNALSMAVAPALAVSLYEKMGYRLSFVLSAIFALLCLLIVQFVKDKGLPIDNIKKDDGIPQIIEIKALPIAVIVMLFAIPYCATQSFLISYVNHRQVAVATGLFFPLYAIILLILRFSFKSKFDKWSFGIFFWAGCLSAAVSMLSLTFLENNLILFVAAAFMAGGYGIMCSVSQSTAILLAGRGKRGVANSTYYVGLDLGMALGPFLGGILYDAVPHIYFYPCLMICIPISILVFAIWQISTLHKK